MGEETDLMLKNNETIGKCKNYKYLRINFNDEGADYREIISRVNKTRKITEAFNAISWRTKIGK